MVVAFRAHGFSMDRGSGLEVQEEPLLITVFLATVLRTV